VKQTAESRQVLLFSATLPSALAEFTRLGLTSPEFVRLDADTKLSPDLKLQFFGVRAPDKPAALLHVLLTVIPEKSPTIVFAATKHQVEFLSLLLEQVRLFASLQQLTSSLCFCSHA
jgi:ATP-dependent RNA helicase DDX54/DBP10